MNARDNNSVTALMYASAGGNAGVVEILLSKGADMNVQSSDGGTALMYATRNGCDSVVELLEKHGAH